MNDRTRYILGVGTIVGILGLTIASIVVYKRQQKEEDGVIDINEARSIVNASDKKIVKDIIKPDNMDVLVDKVRYNNIIEDEIHEAIKAKHLKDVERENRLEAERIVEEELREEEIVQEPILLEDEGDGKLRYDPNSDEALLQFMKMELAEWAPNEEEYTVLLRLFDVPFEPIVDGDVVLYSKLRDYRGEFFGPASRWADRVSFADVVLHYARSADFNLGGSIKHWANTFLKTNGLYSEISEEGLIEFVDEMNKHRYEEGDAFYSSFGSYGLFGIDDSSMESALEVANGNVDNSLTYDIEFNEFLKQFN